MKGIRVRKSDHYYCIEDVGWHLESVVLSRSASDSDHNQADGQSSFESCAPHHRMTKLPASVTIQHAASTHGQIGGNSAARTPSVERKTRCRSRLVLENLGRDRKPTLSSFEKKKLVRDHVQDFQAHGVSLLCPTSIRREEEKKRRFSWSQSTRMETPDHCDTHGLCPASICLVHCAYPDMVAKNVRRPKSMSVTAAAGNLLRVDWLQEKRRFSSRVEWDGT